MSRFQIGRFRCAVIEAGPLGSYQATGICVNATPEEAADLLGGGCAQVWFTIPSRTSAVRFRPAPPAVAVPSDR